MLCLDAQRSASMLSQNCVIAKNVKSCSYCRCATLIVWVGGMPWTQTTGATHYNTQLGLPDKVVLSKGWCVGLVLCCGQDGYQAQVPQHPWLHADIIHYLSLYKIETFFSLSVKISLITQPIRTWMVFILPTSTTEPLYRCFWRSC